jgi:type IV pilus assembly protein PilO
MRSDFKLEKRAILLGVALLVIADVALAVYGWKLASSPRSPQDFAVLTRNRDLLRADIKRAQDIRQKIPAIQKDCDQFEQSLYPSATGYSSVAAELGAIANKSGLQLESQSFRQNDVKGRGLTEVIIEATVTGSYSGVVHFLNGLQRSNNVYAVESLAAKSEAQQPGARGGGVRVTMHIRTYFRTT